MSKNTYYGNQELKYYGDLTIDYGGTFAETLESYQVVTNGSYSLYLGSSYLNRADSSITIRSGWDSSSGNKNLYLNSNNGGDVFLIADVSGNSGDLNLRSYNQMNITTYSGGVDGSDINISCGQDLLANADGGISLICGNDSSLTGRSLYLESKNGAELIAKSSGSTHIISNQNISLYPDNDDTESTQNRQVRIGNFGRLWFADNNYQASVNYHFGLYRWRNANSKNQMVIALQEEDSGILINNINTNCGEIKLKNQITKKIFISPFSFVARAVVDLDTGPLSYGNGSEFKIANGQRTPFDLLLDFSTLLPDLSEIVSAKLYIQTTDGSSFQPGDYVSVGMKLHKQEVRNNNGLTETFLAEHDIIEETGTNVAYFPQPSTGTATFDSDITKTYTIEVPEEGGYRISHSERRLCFLELTIDGIGGGGNKSYAVRGVQIAYKTYNPTCFGSTSNYKDYDLSS